MKKIILLFFILFLPVTEFTSAAKDSPEWTEVQSAVVPSGTPLYHYYSKEGNIKYVLSLGDINVPVSTKNAEGYLSGLYKLEVVKWYSPVTQKYKYTTRQYKPNQKDIDLQTVFGTKVKPITYFNPKLNED